MPQTVAIFGGGVAGLTAAHELACRGFKVDVYEPRPTLRGLGGKARSQFFTPKSANGELLVNGELPGEHGFRFFPNFYELVHDTMSRIPLDAQAGSPANALHPHHGPSVRDNLVLVPEDGMGRAGRELMIYPRRQAKDAQQVTDLVRMYLEGIGDGAGLPIADVLHIGAYLVDFVISGDRRRLAEYERQSFWQYVHADALSPLSQRVVQGMPKVLVAMDAKQGNARTLGNVLFLIMRDMLREESEADAILNRPTTEAWIAPWQRWLDRLGVTFRCGEGYALRRLECAVGAAHIRRAWLADGSTVEADHYITAVPLDVMHGLVTDDLATRCPTLDRMRHIDLARALGWMVGVQFYLRNDVPLVKGHVGFRDASWAITGVSQARFWSPNDFRHRYGQEVVGGVISADICEWFATKGSVVPKVARQCTRDELFRELVHQIGAVLFNGRPILDPANIVAWHLDDDIRFNGDQIDGNDSRLLIHPPGLWGLRPTAALTIDNLYLAGDYVQNDMDLATMEGANQAARAAVDGILDRTGSPAPRCRSNFGHLAANEPVWLQVLKAFDDATYPGPPPLTGALHAVGTPPGLPLKTLASTATDPDQFWNRIALAERHLQTQADAWASTHPLP